MASDSEGNLNFSKASFSRPPLTGATSPPRVQDNRVMNPAQLNRQKFCHSARFSCGSQPDHPCCGGQAPAPSTGGTETKDSFEAADDVSGHQFDEDDSEDLNEFDFSRISSKATAATAATAVTATTAAGFAAASFKPGSPTDHPEFGKLADGPTKFLGGQRRAMKPTDGQVRGLAIDTQKSETTSIDYYAVPFSYVLSPRCLNPR